MRSFAVATLLAVVGSTLYGQGKPPLAPPCVPGTLANYLALSQCSVGILNFSGFSFTPTATAGSPTLLTAAQIQVTPASNDTLGGGFSFSAANPAVNPFAVGANETATYFIDYFLAIDPGPVGGRANLDMDPPFGNVSITQRFCPDGPLAGRNSCATGFQGLTVTTPPCGPIALPAFCAARLTFSPPIQNFAEVETTIVLTGSPASGSGFDSVTGTVAVFNNPVAISKSFAAVSSGNNGTTSLTFTLNNPNSFVSLTGIAFMDTLPAGMVVAVPSGLTGACAPGAIAAAGNTISLGNPGATLAPGASCTFKVNVTSDGTALGYLTNTTGVVTANEAPSGAPAAAAIFVGDPFQITYAANLSVGDSVVNITNAGALGASLPSGTTATIAGALCANVYAFTPDEQLVSCCSCPVTPNGLVSLSAKEDLAGNTLTPAVPTALVVKVLATVPVGGSCNNSAAAVGVEALANGMKAFGTTIHATPVAGTFGVTERPFSSATLSAGELSRLGNLCNFILANGSGFGICRSCRLGGLGTTRQ